MELPDALAWLHGEWEGEGQGEYPGVEPFDYRELVTFTRYRTDRPVLAFEQRTWVGKDPSHAENGFLRAIGDDQVELVVTQAAGVVAVYQGTAVGNRIELATVAVASTPTATPVTEIRWVIEHRDGDTLWYSLDMAANGKPLAHHTEATLHREL